MKRGLLGALILSLIGLMVMIFVGCSSRVVHEAGRDQRTGTAARIYSPRPKAEDRNVEVADPREEELWIIGRGEQQQARTVRQEFEPGSGVLATRLENQDKLVPVPLKHTDVKASVAGYIATVDVTQQYENPYTSKIEAVYVFPLPDNAAINEFVMTI